MYRSDAIGQTFTIFYNTKVQKEWLRISHIYTEIKKKEVKEKYISRCAKAKKKI